MALPIRLDAGKSAPIYRQIHDQLRDLIYSGHLPPGTPLPSIRALAQDLGCSVITTRRAYQDLESEGLILTQQGRGTFVAKVDDPKREAHRREHLCQAFADAIEQGIRMDFSLQEIRMHFEEVLQRSQSGTIHTNRRKDNNATE
jgi:GntR family transcriptional regulator